MYIYMCVCVYIKSERERYVVCSCYPNSSSPLYQAVRLAHTRSLSFCRDGGPTQRFHKQRNKVLTLAHAQTIHYISN